MSEKSPTEIFLQEAEEILAEVEDCILDLEENPADREGLNRLFRFFHTIKGSSGMFGYDEISGFTHTVETVLGVVRDEAIPLTHDFINLILAARDHIKFLLMADGSSDTERSSGRRIVAALQNFLPEAKATDSEEASPSASAPREQGREKEGTPHETTWRIRFKPHEGIISTGLEPGILLDDLRKLGECTVTAQTDDIPSLERINPEKCFFVWDIILTTASDLNTIEDAFIFVEDESSISIQKITRRPLNEDESPVPRLGEILVERGDVRPQDISRVVDPHRKQIGDLLVEAGIVSRGKVISALNEQKIHEKQRSKAVEASIRVASAKLDHLINLVGELVITQAAFSQFLLNMEDVEELEPSDENKLLLQLVSRICQPVEILDRLTRDLRNIALNMRMVPIGSLFGRFRRLVRDLSGELDKEIELITEGEETELDKTIIDKLADPMIHLIRNSIDHGIAHPEKRISFGKSPRGTIRLKADHKGANVIITIEDDGMGFDAEAILEKAKEKGLVRKNEAIETEEIFQLVFQPGFSTASRVTSVSGRGVGLDVVKREIDALGGSVKIESEKPHFSRIRLTLPLTLAIIDGLLIKISGKNFVLPLTQVLECIDLTDTTLIHGSRRNMFLFRGELIPFIRLSDLFHFHAETEKATEHMAIVQSGNLRIGVVVDQIVGNVQTVIKSLDRNLKDTPGISGATILGDGTVALILDIPAVVRLAREEEGLV